MGVIVGIFGRNSESVGVILGVLIYFFILLTTKNKCFTL